MSSARQFSEVIIGSAYDLADDTTAHQEAILTSSLGDLFLEAFHGSDPITCKVINALTGTPAKNMRVTLHCTTIPTIHYHRTTNELGNILNWKNTQSWCGGPGVFVRYHGGVNPALKYTVENYAEKESDSKFRLDSVSFGWSLIPLITFGRRQLVLLGSRWKLW